MQEAILLFLPLRLIHRVKEEMFHLVIPFAYGFKTSDRWFNGIFKSVTWSILENLTLRNNKGRFSIFALTTWKQAAMNLSDHWELNSAIRFVHSHIKIIYLAIKVLHPVKMRLLLPSISMFRASKHRDWYWYHVWKLTGMGWFPYHVIFDHRTLLLFD